MSRMTENAAGAAVSNSVLQGGRRKAYRPLPQLERREAVDSALAAWARGDWFETHELLEPAWMGTADPAERDLYQGLIKLAAAFVHQVRGNRAGVTKNLVGARERIAAAAAEAVDRDGDVEGFEPAALLPAFVALERQAAAGAPGAPGATGAIATAARPLVRADRLGSPVAPAIPGLTPPVLRRTSP
jgi:hypothetical protein